MRRLIVPRYWLRATTSCPRIAPFAKIDGPEDIEIDHLRNELFDDRLGDARLARHGCPASPTRRATPGRAWRRTTAGGRRLRRAGRSTGSATGRWHRAPGSANPQARRPARARHPAVRRRRPTAPPAHCRQSRPQRACRSRRASFAFARSTNIDRRFCTAACRSPDTSRRIVSPLRHVRNDASRRPFAEQ